MNYSIIYCSREQSAANESPYLYLNFVYPYLRMYTYYIFMSFFHVPFNLVLMMCECMSHCKTILKQDGRTVGGPRLIVVVSYVMRVRPSARTRSKPVSACAGAVKRLKRLG